MFCILYTSGFFCLELTNKRIFEFRRALMRFLMCKIVIFQRLFHHSGYFKVSLETDVSQLDYFDRLLSFDPFLLKLKQKTFD